MTKICCATGLRTALAMACAAAFAFGASSVNAAGGYTYNLVRLFDSTSSPETLAEYVLNDNGQVAYLTTAASTVSGGGISYYIHLWDPKAAVVDSVVYTAQSLSCSTSSIGICSGTSNPVPALRGSLGYSGSLALSNTGVVSVAAYFPQAGNVLTYSNTGYINIDLTQQPALSYTVSINNFSQGGLFTQGTQLSAAGGRAVVDSGAPGTSALNLGVASPGGLLLSSAPLNGYWYTGTPGSGSTRPVPAINSAGLASVITSALAGPPPSLVDLPAGSTTPSITAFGDGTWVSTGHLALNSRGEAAIMTVTPFRAALMPAVRTASPRVLADASVFSNSAPVYAISLSDRDELTFQTIEGGMWPGIWSVAADGAPVEVFSSLDPTFVVHDAVSGAVIEDLSPCNGGTTCTGNHAGWIQSGSYEPYDNIIANNQGAVAFYMVSGNVGPLVVAVPTPGLRPSAPLTPTSQDPTTYLMNFLGPCAALYGGSGFLTPALTTPGGAFNGTCYVDPPTATGYTLTAASGADNFQAVIVPSPLAGGQNSFSVNFQTNGAATSAPLTAGQVYTFPAGGVGTFSITGINATENLSPADPNAFVLGLTWVNRGAQPTDFTLQPQVDTGPTITNSITGTLGANGWYTSNVTLNWTVTDPLGMITNETGCSATVVTSDTSGQTVTCSATSAGGTTSQSVTIKRDATPPVANATALPLPDGFGWNNTSVTVSFQGTDATSGIASCSTSILLSAQGANQSVSGTCTDNAGNVSAPATVSGIDIEYSDPVVSDTLSGVANAAGWFNSPVTVSFSGTDPLSGVAPNGCTTPITVSTNGSNQSVSGTCTNLAGDATTVTVTGINVDTIAPVATAIAAPQPNANGWNNTAVTVSFAGTDNINGSGIAACSPDVVLAAQGANQLASGACTDIAGNVSASATASVNIELSPPVVSIVIPQTGSGFPVGYNVAANYRCTAASTVLPANCAGPVANGVSIDTSTAGTQQFSVTATDQAGNVSTASSTYLVSTLDFTSTGSIWTYAGNGLSGFSGDGGPAIAGSITFSDGVAVDTIGNVYIADTSNHRIRKVSLAGIISTVAGNGIAGFSGDGGDATAASIFEPGGVAIDAAGNLYIADTNNSRVRRVDAATGIITTVAGNGSFSYSGDGGPASLSALHGPAGLAFDATGNLYIADQQNARVREINATTGIITTVAGNGNIGYSGDGGAAIAAALNYPTGIALDATGNLFIADEQNQRVRRVDAVTGVITTAAGNGTAGYSGDGAAANSASLYFPTGVALDAAGNLFIADIVNNRIRRVDATTQLITTVIGTGEGNFAGDGGTAGNAGVNNPYSLAFGAGGNLYVADSGNFRVRLAVGIGSAASNSAPPVITPSVTGTLGNNGWYTGNVSVSWSVTGQSITSQIGCGATTISTDTTGRTLTCSATNPAGTTNQTVVIKRDSTPPVAIATPSPLPDSFGWNNTAVTVAFSGADSTSGIASCSPSIVLNSQGANQSASGTCTDNAGNISSPAVITGIDIEFTAPVVADAISDVPNSAGWFNAPVTISFTATDPLSGVAPNGCTSPITISTNGSGESVSGSCTDRAGNTSILTLTGLNIDTIPPVAVPIAAPPPNANGWNNSAVTVSFTGTDHLNGSGIAGCSPDVILSAQGAGQAASGTCTSVAGNVSVPATDTVNIDFTPPLISILSPVPNDGFVIGEAQTASYSCSDTLSGIASCAGPVATGAQIDTTTLGAVPFSVTGTDLAGNTASVSDTYTVNPAGTVIITTRAGNGTLGYSGDGGPATSAQLNVSSSMGMALDAAGNLYISDPDNHVIRKINSAGVISTVSVKGLLFEPSGLAADAAGNLYIADEGYQLVFKMTPAGVLSIVAGTGGVGYAGDGGLAINAVLNGPEGVAVDAAGNLYIADTGNNVIRMVNTAGIISTVAGNFQDIQSLSVDAAGNLYFADRLNNVVRLVSPTGAVSIVAGNGTAGYSGDGGQATAAEFNQPNSVTVDAGGNLYIADRFNNIIREVSPTGIVSTVAGNGSFGYSGDGGPATAAKLNNPYGVVMDGAGSYYTLDLQNLRLRRVRDTTYTFAPSAVFGSQAVNTASTAQVITLTNRGVSAVAISGFALGGANPGQFKLLSSVPSGYVLCPLPHGSLAVGGSCSVAVQFTPTSAGTKSAVLTVTAGGGPGTKSVSLSGTGGDTYSLSPHILAFGNEPLGVPSAAGLVTLTNTGVAALAISSITLGGNNPGQFSLTSTAQPCGTSLAVGASCKIGVQFDPTGNLAYSAILSVKTGGGTGTQTVSLTGIGTVPTYALSVSALAFGNQAETVASAAQTITLTNTGALALPITSISVPAGQFSQSNNCPSSVATGGSCTINVVFTPSSAGAKTATLTVKAGGGAATQTVTLTGTGIVPTFTLSPSTLAFGSQGESVASPPLTITLTNTGSVTLPITSISVPAGHFAQSNNCPPALAAGAACQISVVFTPTSAGAKTATLTVKGGDGAIKQTASLSGTGVVATYTVAPTSLAFGNQAHGTSSAAKVVTVTNTGTVPLLIAYSSSTLAGANPTQYIESSNCGVPLAAGGSCTISVFFFPGSTGSKPATLAIAPGGGAAGKNVPLTGTGT